LDERVIRVAGGIQIIADIDSGNPMGLKDRKGRSNGGSIGRRLYRLRDTDGNGSIKKLDGPGDLVRAGDVSDKCDPHTAAGLRLDVTLVELGSTESTVPERSTLTGLLPESEVTDKTPIPGAPTETGVNSTASAC
jgi:hypothetical protein